MAIVALLVWLGGCGRWTNGDAGTAIAPPPVPLAFDASPTVDGLRIELSDADPPAAAIQPEGAARRAPAAVLSDAELAPLLARMEPLAPEAGDRAPFALPPGSRPPPRPGSDVLASEPTFPEPARPPTPSASALSVVRHSPDGPVPMAPTVSVTFDQPMVAVTSQAEAANTVPVVLKPEVEGTWRWLGTKTAVFRPTFGRMPMATEFTATIPAGTKSASGAALAAAAVYRFDTPPPSLRASWPDTDERQSLTPVVVLAFDQPVDVASVVSHLALGAAEVRLASDAEIAADAPAAAMLAAGPPDQVVAVVPTAPLPRDTRFVPTLRRGVASPEGPRLTEGEFTGGAFRTHGDLTVTGHHCWEQRPCPPTSSHRITLSNPLDAERFDPASVTISPEVRGLAVAVQGDELDVSGAFVGRTRYTVTVPASLRDRFGQTLGHEASVTFGVGPAETTLSSTGQAMVVLDPAASAALPVWTTNHAALKVDVHAVAPEDWPKWLDWLSRYQYDDARPGPLPGRAVHQGVVKVEGANDVPVETRIDLAPYCKDGVGQFTVLVQPTVQPRDPWNRQYVMLWVQVTRLGLVAFVDGEQLVGWANDLGTGDNRPGVALRFGKRAGEGSEPGSATTGADGLAELALPAASDGRNVLVATLGADVAFLPETTYAWAGGNWFRGAAVDDLGWYVADDRGIYRPGEHARIKGWIRRHGRGPTGDVAPIGTSDAKVSWVATDALGSPIGDGEVAVSALGGFAIDVALPDDVNLGVASLVLRASGLGDVAGLSRMHPLEVQAFRTPEFEVGTAVDRDARILGERGTATVSAGYYAGGPLGAAPVTWRAFGHATAYAPPGWATFTFGHGGYGFGRGFGRGFGGAFGGGFDDGYGYGEALLGEHTGATDASGDHRLAVHLAGVRPAVPWSVRLEASVEDVNRQLWTSSSTMLVHPASRYVGLHGPGFVDPDHPFDIDVVVTDVDGAAQTDPAELTFARMEWSSDKDGVWAERPVSSATEQPAVCAARPAADGHASCRFSAVRGGSWRVLATVRDRDGRTSETELRVWVSGAPTPPARDVQLEQVTLATERDRFAGGDTARLLVVAPFWPAEATLTLRRDGVLDRRRFRMDGPTATLDVPITEAMVPGVLAHVELVGSAQRTDDHGEPLPDAPRRVAHASGEVSLAVSTDRRALTVTAAPSAAEVAPGSDVDVAIDVKRADGQPVTGAELVVVVADEAVLALTGHSLPDPLDVFYASRPPGVIDQRLREFAAVASPDALAADKSGLTLNGRGFGVITGATGLGARGTGKGGGGRFRSTADAEFAGHSTLENQVVTLAQPARESRAQGVLDGLGGLGFKGGGANDQAPMVAVRSDLSPLALFAPDVRTDAGGHAVVALHLPDGLTRYRIMVVAVDAGNGFGAVDGAITARLPLMVRPSAPRFLNFGDQLELPVVVQNPTDAAVEVDVAVRAANLRFVDAVGAPGVLPDLPDVATSSAGRRVTVPAGDRVEVRFPAATVLAGTARLQVVAAVRGKGGAADASSVTLPVWTPATTEAFATYGAIDGASGALGIVQPVQAPPEAWPTFGGLDVATSSTQLQTLTDAVLYLQSYPFECNEQLASRVLAIASLRDVMTAFDAPGLPPAAELETQVGADLDRLAARQNWNGGFAFWRKGDEPWPFLSVHVANAFARAKAKGYDVPTEAWARSLQHLRDIRGHVPWYYAPESRWFIEAYALDVRRRMGDADPGRARALYAEAGGPRGLGIDGLAFLLPTLQDGGASAQVTAILRHISNNTTESAGSAHFVTSYSDGAYALLHSDRRADGIVLEALMELPAKLRDDALVTKVVAGLLGHRTKGRWSNTQENAFVLLAMDRYFRTYEAATPDFVARVWLGDDYVGEHAFRGRTTERSHVEVPMGLLTEHGKDTVPLTVARDGAAGRLYYRIGLTYAPKDLRLGPEDDGFAVERTYEAIDAPGDVRRDPDGTWRIKAGARVRVKLAMATPMRRNHVALVDPLPAGLEAQNPALATTGTLPPAPPDAQPRWWWWSRTWWEHENLRDDRVEAYTSLLWDGAYDYAYVARATTPGAYVVPPAKAEEMYAPETFGRSGTDRVVVE